jgi:gluconokinase
VVGGATSEGGNVVAWCRRVLDLPEHEELEAALAAIAPDAHGLTVLPFLAGERSPGWRADARGTLTGLTLDVDGPEILRALMEAVAYRLAMVYELLSPLAHPGHAVVASGGALTRSQVWSGIVADVLGVPLTISAEGEASSRGAAVLALEGLGRSIPVTGLAGASVVHPDPRRHEVYRRALERQRRLYENVVGPPLS